MVEIRMSLVPETLTRPIDYERELVVALIRTVTRTLRVRLLYPGTYVCNFSLHEELFVINHIYAAHNQLNLLIKKIKFIRLCFVKRAGKSVVALLTEPEFRMIK